jgi:hypothetical protein
MQEGRGVALVFYIDVFESAHRGTDCACKAITSIKQLQRQANKKGRKGILHSFLEVNFESREHQTRTKRRLTRKQNTQQTQTQEHLPPPT